MRAIISSSLKSRFGWLTYCQQVFNGGVFFFLRLTFAVFFITPETEAVLLTKAVGIKQRVDGIAVIFLHPLREACCHDSLGMMRGVNAHDIQQICRTHRPAKLFFHHFVDLAEIRAVAQQLAETGEMREQHAVNKEAGAVVNHNEPYCPSCSPRRQLSRWFRQNYRRE